MSSSATPTLFDDDRHASFACGGRWRMTTRGEPTAASSATARLASDAEANRAAEERAAPLFAGDDERGSRFAREPR